MNAAGRLLDNKPLLWLLLSVPAIFYVKRFVGGELPFDLIPSTGELSARLIIFVLMLTPLSILFRRQRWIAWLIRRRRAFGVAAFGYALMHLFFYVLDMETPEAILSDAEIFTIWTGWGALFLFLPLALTSNDASMRLLKKGWKRLQRLAYPAAILTLVHWMFIHDDLEMALIHFAPLGALELYRLVHFARTRISRTSTLQPRMEKI